MSTEICLGCDEKPALRSGFCSDCEELRSEAAFERMYEGEPPVSVQERYEQAWHEKRRLR